MLRVIRKDGLTAGFEFLRARYEEEPATRSICHAVATLVGGGAYREFPDYRELSYKPASAWCNYGFYQEYPRAMLLDAKDAEEAVAFCRYAAAEVGDAAPALSAECFRGIGRGLPFISGTDDIRKMASFMAETCGRIAREGLEHRECLSGGFNQLGRDRDVARKYLAVPRADPLSLCAEQADPRAVPVCYGNFKWVALDLASESGFEDRWRSFLKSYPGAPDATQRSIIWTLGYDAARKDLASASENALRDCALVPDRFKTECASGYSVGIVKHGTPGVQHAALIDFCKAIVAAGAVKEGVCPSAQTIEYLRGFYPPEHFREACRAFRAELGSEC